MPDEAIPPEGLLPDGLDSLAPTKPLLTLEGLQDTIDELLASRRRGHLDPMEGTPPADAENLDHPGGLELDVDLEPPCSTEPGAEYLFSLPIGGELIPGRITTPTRP